jgi:hypothetical protein
VESYKDLPWQKKKTPKEKLFFFNDTEGLTYLLPNKIRLGTGELSLSKPMPAPAPGPVDGYCHDIKNIPARLTAPLNKCCQLTSAPQNVGLAGSRTKLPLHCSTCSLGNPLIPVSIYPFFPRFFKTFICFYFKLFFYYFYMVRIVKIYFLIILIYF